MKKFSYSILLLWVLLCSFNFPEEKKYLAQKAANIPVFNSKGDTTEIYKLIENKPLIISPIYTKCYSLCGIISGGLQSAIQGLGTLGKDFTMVSFSFDSTDTPNDLLEYEDRWKMDKTNWKTVSATSKNIQKLMESVGYQYDYIEVTKEYSHPSILIVLTPSGKISRYIYGINPSPKDIKLSVIEAMSEKTTPGLINGFYLRCFGYDPILKTYKMDWRFIISTSAGLIIIGIVSSIFIKTFIVSKD